MAKEKNKLKSEAASSGPRQTFDNLVKQASEQWDTLIHNPQFVGALAATLEQPLNLAHRVQELVGASLRTMNITTRDDYQALMRRLDDISDQLEDVITLLEQTNRAAVEKERVQAKPAAKPAPKPAPKPAAKAAGKAPAKRAKAARPAKD